MGRTIFESNYKEIKEYLDHCDSPSFVAKKTGFSVATIHRIKNSSSYDDYKAIVNAESGFRKNEDHSKEMGKTKEEKTQPGKNMIVSFDQFRCLAKDVDSIKQMLTQNNMILAAIHDLLK